jgi:hypothetical protein
MVLDAFRIKTTKVEYVNISPHELFILLKKHLLSLYFMFVLSGLLAQLPVFKYELICLPLE